MKNKRRELRRAVVFLLATLLMALLAVKDIDLFMSKSYAACSENEKEDIEKQNNLEEDMESSETYVLAKEREDKISLMDEVSGTCGENLIWKLEQNNTDNYSPKYTLTISGEGAMADYTSDSGAPWEKYSEEVVINTVVIEDGVTTIGNRAFWNFYFLSRISIPDTVTTIGDNAFTLCLDLESITIPDSVTTIGNNAFDYCWELSNVNFGENTKLTTIGDYAFYACKNLTSITIPDSVTVMGNHTFYYCEGLMNVYFAENSKLTTIGDYAFAYCDALTNITIPNSVTAINADAFCECTELRNVIYHGTKSQWTGITIDDENNECLTSAVITCTTFGIPVTYDTLEFTYDGTPKIPAVTIANDEITLTEDTDYELYDAKTNAGSYTLEIKGLGDYAGTVETLEWSIVKAEPTVPTGLVGCAGNKLFTLKLPQGWSWSDDETVMKATGEQNFVANYAGSNNYKEKANVKVTVEVLDKTGLK